MSDPKARRLRPHRLLALVAAATLGLQAGAAQTSGALAATPVPVINSSLDAQLFYQLLVGEMELRSGDVATAFEVVLDAARRAKDDQLFKRAVDIAVQARAADQAITAAKAWRTTLPESVEAHRYSVQLLAVVNKLQEAAEPLRALLALVPESERSSQINTLPRYFQHATDRRAVATLLEQSLQPYVQAPATRTASRVTLGRVWLAASASARALEFAERAHADEPDALAPALLALELLPATPAAERIVTGYLKTPNAVPAVRLAYARTLALGQQYGEATTQLELVTKVQPQWAAPWLSLGALRVELRQPQPAEEALKRYVELTQSASSPASRGQANDDDDDPTASSDQGLTQAWLLLAQAAEQRGDLVAAEGWLKRIENPQRALDVQVRRASLMVRQGKVEQARALIRAVPERSSEDARTKLLAEAQLLREAKRWNEADELLKAANARFPDDVELLYERAMLAEKLNRMDEMEKLLRRVIELKPDHHHAYNALGYSLADRNLRLDEAKGLIQKALEFVPGEPFITDSLGWVEYRLGHSDEAVRLLRKAYAARPDVEIAAHLGEVLWTSGQRDEARRLLREARQRDANNETLKEMLARLKVDL